MTANSDHFNFSEFSFRDNKAAHQFSLNLVVDFLTEIAQPYCRQHLKVRFIGKGYGGRKPARLPGRHELKFRLWNYGL